MTRKEVEEGVSPESEDDATTSVTTSSPYSGQPRPQQQ